MPFIVGESVGPYRILEQLGQGGMATVFKAYHAALDRYVALKALHPAFTLEPNFLARFQREAQVVARLEHPNIVPIFDFAEHEGRPYLVMKFIEGETLKARLSRGMLTHEELMNIVESVGAALEYAHQQGVLHRDVKPSNVLLATDGRIYLADFGLARMAQAGESTISSDVMLGTPQYISPEQAMGRRDLDSGTDIYSFGVLLYELLVGRVPYSADTPYSIIHDHIYAPLPLPRNIQPNIPEAVERVLLKALSKERGDRFDSIAAMVDAWKHAWEGSAPAPLPEPPVAEAAALLDEQPSAAPIYPRAEMSEAREAPVPPLPPEEPAGGRVKKKKSRRVLWVLLGLTCLFVLCFCALILLSQGKQAGGRKKATSQDVATPTQVVAAPSQTLMVNTLPPPTSLPAEATPTIEAFAAALKRVTAEPDNPLAHFNLGAAYWEAGMMAEAEAEFQLASQLTGAKPNAYMHLGDIFRMRERPILAARAYIEAVKLTADPLPTELVERLAEAMYLAAKDASANKAGFDEESVKRADPQILDIARARYLLYQGNIEGADQALEVILASEKVRPEAKLLQAEILYAQDEKDEARQKLEALKQDPNLPLWVRLFTEKFINQVKP